VNTVDLVGKTLSHCIEVLVLGSDQSGLKLVFMVQCCIVDYCGN